MAIDRETSQMTNLIHVLKNIRLKFEQHKLPARKELKDLLELCEHPRENIRESALILLLHPPVNDELAYYRWLLSEILENVPHINRLPAPILELIFDLIGFFGEIPKVSPFSHLTGRMLNHLFKSFFAELLEKPVPIRPFLPWVKPRTVMPRDGVGRKNLTRRWRLLRNAILKLPESAAAFELTWGDLRPLFPKKYKSYSRIQTTASGRWRNVGRVLLLPAGCSPANDSRLKKFNKRGEGVPLPALHDGAYFKGLGNGSLRYLDLLIQRQAVELAAVRGLAAMISKQTRRVVLSWHNAGLASAGGWAFEDLNRQFPSDALWQGFKKTVQSRMESINAPENLNRNTLDDLFKLWEERLVKPKVAHALWESRLRASFDHTERKLFEKNLRSAEALLKDSEVAAICKGEIYSWHGAVSPHQRMTLDQVLGWQKVRKGIWQEGLIRLTAMIEEGQDLMTVGKIPYCVLPWIDKFFISSRREDDIEYLPSLVNFFEGRGISPLILFWEDTSHGQAPSLQLAVKRLAAQGVPFRGIGVFGPTESSRTQALQYIINEHQKIRLFALRPYNDVHYPKSFCRLLHDRDYRFFQHYDSSWKDNLVFIYVGTQVFPLLSVQCDVESFPAWIGIGSGKYPFGLYLRKRLRKMTLGERDEGADRFSSEYAHWANLC